MLYLSKGISTHNSVRANGLVAHLQEMIKSYSVKCTMVCSVVLAVKN